MEDKESGDVLHILEFVFISSVSLGNNIWLKSNKEDVKVDN